MPKYLIILTLVAAVLAGPAAAATKTASLQDDFFTKGKLTIKKNDTVVWKWNTDDKHTVTEIHGKWGSTKEAKKDTVKHKFKKRGKFTVYCLVHPTVMRQKIIVK